jgi:hypothetical protein
MARSGQFVVDNIKAEIEIGRPTFSGRMILLMNPLVRLFTSSSCRIEKWPLSRVPIGALGRQVPILALCSG